MTEYDEQLTVFEYAHGLGGNLDNRLRLLHVIENTKGAGRPAAGAKESSGIPDMFLPVAITPHHGLYIELKALKGRISPKQKDWQRALRQQKYASEVCFGADEAIEMLTHYLSGNLPPF